MHLCNSLAMFTIAEMNLENWEKFILVSKIEPFILQINIESEEIQETIN